MAYLTNKQQQQQKPRRYIKLFCNLRRTITIKQNEKI